MPSVRKFKIYFAFFSYGGNGGIACISPYLRKWWGQLTMHLATDPRIGQENFVSEDISDTPITMTRNKAVARAKQWGADIIVMIDSDNVPDLLVSTDKTAKPFFSSSFDFIADNWDKGPHVVFAPYCGPPVHPVFGGEEYVYVFQWVQDTQDEPDTGFRLEGYKREQASLMRGIQAAAAGPTGVIMYDMRAFDLIPTPYFAYEFNKDESEKASTEDVYNTRNISLAGCNTLGYNPMFCNWDAWAGHAKTKIVGPPRILYAEQVADSYRKAVLDDVHIGTQIVDFEASPLPRKQMKLATPKFQMGDHLEDWEAKEWAAKQNAGVEMMSWDKDSIRKLLEEVAGNSKFIRVIEVGTWIGSTAKFMHEVLQELGVAHRIDCIDTFEGTPSDHTSDLAKALGGSTHAKFIENVGDLRGQVIFEHVGSSQDVALAWQDKADLIFIDADHSYEGCKADIESWRVHLKAGGILCGHDYGVSGLEGVTRAVDELADDRHAYFVGLESGTTNSCVWLAKFGPTAMREAVLEEARSAMQESNGIMAENMV
jgi:predicted O-methyltransferase YrrM